MVELLISVVIMPLIVGAVALAFILIINNDGAVGASLSDSADAQVFSANFVQDVQSAQDITTDAQASGQCGSAGTQVLGLEWGGYLPSGSGTEAYQTVVSYDSLKTGSSYSLVRYYCGSGPSTTPTSTTVVSSDIAISSPASSVAAASNNVNVSTFTGTGTLNVASAVSFPTSGTLTVATSTGLSTITYTGTTATTFTGCRTTSGSGVLSTGGALFVNASASTIASGSNNVSVNILTGTGVLSVASTATFPSSGTLTVATSTGLATITYTGITSSTFTGCNTTSGTGTLTTNGAVFTTVGVPIITPVSAATSLASQQWISSVGITAVSITLTEPGSNYTYTLTGDPVPAANAGTSGNTVTPPFSSCSATAGTGTYAGSLCFFTFWDTTTVASGSNGVNVSTFTGTGTLNVAATASFPSSGTLTVTTSTGSAAITYTGKTSTTFTGLKTVSGTGTLTTGKPVGTGFYWGNPGGGSYATESGCGEQMSQGLAGTPFTISFCISASGSGYDNGQVGASPVPTYYNPTPVPDGFASEAFLGNNGFYTGIPGYPALYQCAASKPIQVPVGCGSTGSGGDVTTTLSLSNIEVTNPSGVAVTGWELVTGDAESTDTGESIAWTTCPGIASGTVSSPAGGPQTVYTGTKCVSTDPVLNLLDNSSSSAFGNACSYNGYTGGNPSTPQSVYAEWTNGSSTTTLSQANLSPVTPSTGNSMECAENVQLNKTGTVMLEAAAPSNLTINLNAQPGAQAIFVGVLL